MPDELKKFHVEGYDPRAATDAQLADDFRLLAAKFATKSFGEFGGRTEAVRFGAALVAEILRRGKITFHPSEMKETARETLREMLGRVVTSGAYFTEPHGRLIFEGKKTSVLKSRPFEQLTRFHVLLSGKLAYGYLRCRPPKTMARAKVAEGRERHHVSDEEINKWWPNKSSLLEYPVRDFLPFTRPRPVTLPQGAQTFVREVRFAKAHGPGDDIVLVPAFISQVGSSVYGQDDEAADIDLLYRIDEHPITKALTEGACLRMFQRFDPDKTGRAIHHIFNPTGPHDDHRPLYDLVLRPRNGGASALVKAHKIKLDLGCGKKKPRGYIGIDKADDSDADIKWNLEPPPALGGEDQHSARTIPFADNTVDEIRANHFLEHIQNRTGIMKEVWRCLKPGGRFEFEVPSTKGEGAFAHPDHKSYWNKAAFSFYTEDDLIDSIEFPGAFDVEKMEEETRGDAVYLRGTLIARKPDPLRKASSVQPFGSYVPPKPVMAGRTDAYSTDELWPWAEKNGPVEVEEKLNGLRMIAEKSGSRFRIKTEGGKDLTAGLPMLAEPLRGRPDDFILDCSLWIERGRHPLPRKELMTLLSRNPRLPEGDVVRAICFDLPFLRSDLSTRPLSERRTALEDFARSLPKKHFALTSFTRIKGRKHFDSMFRKLAAAPGSEGMMIKALDSQWPGNGRAPGWAKLKIELELKVKVTAVQKTKGGQFNYTVALAGPSGDVELGKTFSTSIRAAVGDILTVTVQELIPQGEGLRLLGATVADKDPERRQPYTLAQALDMAGRRGQVLQKADKEPPLEEETGGGPRGAGTRGERAAVNWKTNWHRMFPPSGKGTFVYQHHWRGLSEEEAKADEGHLLGTENSVHGDLRASYSDRFSWGFTVFTGRTSDLRHGRDLHSLPADDKLQGVFKLDVPNEWQKITRHAPYVGAPGSVGATSKGWAKLFQADYGTYRIGVWREHFFELFLSGSRLKGRFLIQYAPVGEGGRVWLISKPRDQKPYAETHRRETVVAEVRKKGQRWLVWGSPGSKPELIDVHRYHVPIGKRLEEKRLVYGVVLEPETEDGQGDIYSADEIEKACHSWMRSRHPVDVQHAYNPGGLEVVECYVTKQNENWNGEIVKRGSWVVGSYVGDDETWAGVKSGKLTGYSIEGTGYGHFEEAAA